MEVLKWNELDDHLASGGILLDVRTPREVEGGGIDGAVHIPLDELRDRLGELPKDKTIGVMCAVGLRGYLASRILAENGFRAKNLDGGIGCIRTPRAGNFDLMRRKKRGRSRPRLFLFVSFSSRFRQWIATDFRNGGNPSRYNGIGRN